MIIRYTCQPLGCRQKYSCFSPVGGFFHPLIRILLRLPRNLEASLRLQLPFACQRKLRGDSCRRTGAIIGAVGAWRPAAAAAWRPMNTHRAPLTSSSQTPWSSAESRAAAPAGGARPGTVASSPGSVSEQQKRSGEVTASPAALYRSPQASAHGGSRQAGTHRAAPTCSHPHPGGVWPGTAETEQEESGASP